MTTFTTTNSKRLVAGIAAVLGSALMAFEAMPAQAAPPPHAPAWGYRKKQQAANYKNRNVRTRRHSPSGNDIDGDGRWNRGDRDMDGDGIPNTRDRDQDGDGIQDSRDRYPTAPANWYRGSGNRWQRRPKGWRVPASFYRTGNTRVVPRRRVKPTVFTRPANKRVTKPIARRDPDRDGIRNRRDRDIDGDGIRNRRDRDRDGDRVRNRRDRADRNPRRR
jgi:hypothetical protein